MEWTMLHPGMRPDLLGYIADFITDQDPRPAAEQIDAHYRHGGGWQSFKGHTMDPGTHVLRFPGDPPLEPLVSLKLRDELILYYHHSWIAIVQKDGSWDVARID